MPAIFVYDCESLFFLHYYYTLKSFFLLWDLNGKRRPEAKRDLCTYGWCINIKAFSYTWFVLFGWEFWCALFVGKKRFKVEGVRSLEMIYIYPFRTATSSLAALMRVIFGFEYFRFLKDVFYQAMVIFTKCPLYFHMTLSLFLWVTFLYQTLNVFILS